MELAQYILIYLVGSLCVVAFTKDDGGFVQAEKFFLNKDQMSSTENRSKRSAGIIRSTSQANAYMMRYGYLKCKPHSRKKESRMRNRYRLFNRPGSHHHHHQQQSQGSSLLLTLNCDKQRVSQAIMQYQRTYHLPVTGQLDKGTKELMSESRCGNRDQNDGVVDEEVLQAQRILLQQRIQSHQQSFLRSNRRFGRSVELRESLAKEHSEEGTDERESIKEIDNAGSNSGSASKTSTPNPLHQNRLRSPDGLQNTEDDNRSEEDSEPEKEFLFSSKVSDDESLLAPFSSPRTTTGKFFHSLPKQGSSLLKDVFSRRLSKQTYRGQNDPKSVLDNQNYKSKISIGTAQTAENSFTLDPSLKYGGTNEQFDKKDGQSRRPRTLGPLLDKTNLYESRHRWRSTSGSTTGRPSKNNPQTKSVTAATNSLSSLSSLPSAPSTAGTPPIVGGVHNYFHNDEARLTTGSQATPSPWWLPSSPRKYPLLSSSSLSSAHHPSTHSRSSTPASSSFIKSTRVPHTDSGASTDPIRSLDGDGSLWPKYNHNERKDNSSNEFSSATSSISSNSVLLNRTSLKTTTPETTRSSFESEPVEYLTNKSVLNKSLDNDENEAAFTGERKDNGQGLTTEKTTTPNGHGPDNLEVSNRKWTQVRVESQPQFVPIEGRLDRNENNLAEKRPCRAGRADSRDIACPPCKRRASVGSSVSSQTLTLSKTGRESNRYRCRRRRRRLRRQGRHRRKILLERGTTFASPPQTSEFSSVFPSQRPSSSLSSSSSSSLSSSSSSTSSSSSSKQRLKRSPVLQYLMTNSIPVGSQPKSRSWPHPTNTKSFTRESPAYHPTPTTPLLSTPSSRPQTESPSNFSSQSEASPSATASTSPSSPVSPRPSKPLTVNGTPSLTPRASAIDNTHLVSTGELTGGDVAKFSREPTSWPELGKQGDASERVTQGAQMKSSVNYELAGSAHLGTNKRNDRNSRFEKESNNNNNNNNNNYNNNGLDDHVAFKRRRKELLRRPSPDSTSFLKSLELTTPHTRWWNKPQKKSLLLSLIRYKISPEVRHHFQVRSNFLHRTIEQLKKTDPLWLRGVPAQERTKRSLVVNNMTAWGQMFKKKVVRWRLLSSGYSNRIPLEEQRATLTLAFRMWSEVIPIHFVEDLTSDVRDVDIHIAFGRGAHQNCEIDFDGTGGDVAHSWYTGNMHFDDDENFKAIYSPVTSGIYLLRVAVHEIGHVLGLNHTEKVYSIMYAIYHSRRLQRDEFELGWEDRKDIQKIYGVCGGTFNTVFDWVRRRPNEQFIFNTYFFRGNRYWMYENHANRTRYGDPLNIGREWEGVPNDIDGYVHIWFFDSIAGIVDVTYFFKGENYYMYDATEDRVVDSWPRKISEGFGPKEGSTVGIPDNLDSIFFDMRDSNIYFFKGDKVYVYNPRGQGAPSTTGCCERIVNIREEYPTADDNPLPDNLDAVYYSYKEKSMYFLKGEDVWKNVRFHRRQRNTVNEIRHEGKWYDHWYDICDVKNTIITPAGEIEDVGT